tara:strand:+ start:928 stop:3363 length:2436 start_codon:yes stop_codon:yes gene_type:complete
MRNKFLSTLIVFFTNLLLIQFSMAQDQFIFDVSEIQILEDGNKIIGSKRGKILTNDGIVIEADNFIYKKIENILNATGKVTIKDNINNYNISSDNITYERNKEKIFSKGKTKSEIDSRFILESSDVIFLRNEKLLSSNRNSTIIDKNEQTYIELKNLNFFLEDKILKGEKILVNINFNLPQNDKLFFDSGMFNFNKKSFMAKDVKINLKKDIFDNLENDPRLKGLSAESENNITVIKKGVFTSCNDDTDCPPWVITASEIKHDKNKKQLIYDNALLKIYNVPVLYFPKFFHPDPTVKRQSGFLKPSVNNSNILGSSLNLPYYHVISHNKDFTFRPTFFDNDIKMFQNEYRLKNKNSLAILDFSFVDGYQSSLSNKTNSISHFFAEFDANLPWKNFTQSDLFISFKKVSNDTYLKIFDSNIFKNKTTPEDYDVLNSEAQLILNDNNFNLVTGFKSFESLNLASSDRYQFILPYYDFDKQLFSDFNNGTINFKSSGSNDLNNTNNLRTKIINDLNFQSSSILSDNGFKNEYNFYLKNLNTVAKNDTLYKSSPQMELMSIIELNTSLPLIKQTEDDVSYFTPKISFRLNPGDMKDYSSSDRSINVDGIFDINRLAIDDSFEEGKSLTLGVEYKKTRLDDINKFFEAKIATVYRDENENFIPQSTGLNGKDTNIFGSISNSFSDTINVSYDFIMDNDLNTLKYNSLNTSINYKNFNTTFNFIEENGAIGDTNTLENKTSLKFNDENYITFNTRRNRKINLTEYYNLIYEYKNDCLIAGVRYNKSYYEDRDLKPSENLVFSVTLTPLTNFEQKIDQ